MDNKLDGVKVYLECERSKVYVGLLVQTNNSFHFQYDIAYLDMPEAIALGPEMPLRKEPYISKQLFIPFIERIPPRDNPAYSDYCMMKAIDLDECDVLTLVSTLGFRGPSSFIFEPWYDES